MLIMSPARERAAIIIKDFLDMQPPNLHRIISFAKQYEYAKYQAAMACHIAKWSHPTRSEEFDFWDEVQDEIEEL